MASPQAELLAYYYPPPELTVADLVGIAVMPDVPGMVCIDFTGNNTIYVTPQAFVSWCNNNGTAIAASALSNLLNSVYGKLTSEQIDLDILALWPPQSQPIGIFANANDALASWINARGFYWIPYSQFVTGGYSLYYKSFISSNTTQLYALMTNGVVASPVNWTIIEILLVVAGVIGVYLFIQSYSSHKIGVPGAGFVKSAASHGYGRATEKREAQRTGRMSAETTAARYKQLSKIQSKESAKHATKQAPQDFGLEEV